MNTLSCPGCRRTYQTAEFIPTWLNNAINPACPNCGRLLKPDIVLFEEMLPVAAWQQAEDHCLQADLLLVAGSSLEVFPAAQLPWLALEHGAALIIANYDPTPLDTRAELCLPYNLAEALPEIAQAALPA